MPVPSTIRCSFPPLPGDECSEVEEWPPNEHSHRLISESSHTTTVLPCRSPVPSKRLEVLCESSEFVNDRKHSACSFSRNVKNPNGASPYSATTCSTTATLDRRVSARGSIHSSSVAISYKTARRSRIWLGLRKDKEIDTRPLGGYFEALNTFRALSKPLRENKFRHFCKAARTLAILQEAAADPYPPKVGIPVDIGGDAGKVFLEQLQYVFRIAFGMYKPGNIAKYYGLRMEGRTNEECLVEFITSKVSSPRIEILLSDFCALLHRPAYCLLLDHERLHIVLAFRGSAEFSDICTDLQYGTVDSGCHDGMSRAAGWFDEKLGSLVWELVNELTSYQLILCGHSLGGGVASLLTMLWLDEGMNGRPILKHQILCYSFGPPCICLPAIAEKYTRNIFSISYGRDMVSRASLGSLRNACSILNFLCDNSTGSPVSTKRRASQQVGFQSDGSFEDDGGFATDCTIADYHPGAEDGTSCSDGEIRRLTRSSRWKHTWEALLTPQNIAEVTREVGDYLENSLQERVDQIFDNARHFRRTPSRETEPPSLDDDDVEIRSVEHSVTSSGTRAARFENLFERRHQIDGQIKSRARERINRIITTMKRKDNDVPKIQLKSKQVRRVLSFHSKVGPNEVENVREPLRRILTRLRKLQKETDTIRVPAGRLYLLIPAWHFVMAGRDPPLCLTTGGCVLLDVGSDSLTVCRDVIFRRRALHDHYPNYISVGLGLNLPLTVPDEVAQELEHILHFRELQVPSEWTFHSAFKFKKGVKRT